MSKKGPTGDFIFHFCKKIMFFFQKWTIFSYKQNKIEKKKKIAATRWTGNRLFVVDSLIETQLSEKLTRIKCEF